MRRLTAATAPALISSGWRGFRILTSWGPPGAFQTIQINQTAQPYTIMTQNEKTMQHDTKLHAQGNKRTGRGGRAGASMRQQLQLAHTTRPHNVRLQSAQSLQHNTQHNKNPKKTRRYRLTLSHRPKRDLGLSRQQLTQFRRQDYERKRHRSMLRSSGREGASK